MIDFKNLDNKSKAVGTIIVFAVIAVAFWYYSDQFSLWSSTANPWLVMLISILINPAYLFLIFTLYKQYDWKGLLSGIFISIAIDIMSLGHSIPRSGAMPTESSLFTYSDTLIYKILPDFLHNSTGVFILYVVISSGIVYLALRVVRRTATFNKIVREAI